MLNSLFIKNYRNLKELKISSLGRVNLITGKNNTGKSTLLEAVALYASKGSSDLIDQFLTERGENYKDKVNPETIIRSFSSLFTDRKIGFSNEDNIQISSENVFEEGASQLNFLILRFVKFIYKYYNDEHSNLILNKRVIIEQDTDEKIEDHGIGLELRVNNGQLLVPFGESLGHRIRFKINGLEENYQFIRTRNIDREINGELFDKIALTEKEQFVSEALKIIEPTIERIAFIGENSRERTAVIKLTNVASPLPLRSMGDGINRILTIILALVNANSGFLLIDEFENGLHFSVQEKLWDIIFKLAQKLNVQVFVTTHSEDCIAGFENILNNPENQLDGKLIRLDNIQGKIQQVEFSANDLKITTKI